MTTNLPKELRTTLLTSPLILWLVAGQPKVSKNDAPGTTTDNIDTLGGLTNATKNKGDD